MSAIRTSGRWAYDAALSSDESRLPHLLRDLGPPLPHLRRDLGPPLPHLRRDRQVLFDHLDEDQSGQIDVLEFFELNDILNLQARWRRPWPSQRCAVSVWSRLHAACLPRLLSVCTPSAQSSRTLRLVLSARTRRRLEPCRIRQSR